MDMARVKRMIGNLEQCFRDVKVLKIMKESCLLGMILFIVSYSRSCNFRSHHILLRIDVAIPLAM
jgi:hypothetical protein